MTGNLSEAVGTAISKLNDMTVAAQEAYKTDGWTGLIGEITGLSGVIDKAKSSLVGMKAVADSFRKLKFCFLVATGMLCTGMHLTLTRQQNKGKRTGMNLTLGWCGTRMTAGCLQSLLVEAKALLPLRPPQPQPQPQLQPKSTSPLIPKSWPTPSRRPRRRYSPVLATSSAASSE